MLHLEVLAFGDPATGLRDRLGFGSAISSYPRIEHAFMPDDSSSVTAAAAGDFPRRVVEGLRDYRRTKTNFRDV